MIYSVGLAVNSYLKVLREKIRLSETYLEFLLNFPLKAVNIS